MEADKLRGGNGYVRGQSCVNGFIGGRGHGQEAAPCWRPFFRLSDACKELINVHASVHSVMLSSRRELRIVLWLLGESRWGSYCKQRSVKTFLLSFCLITCAQAQWISVGVKGGGALLDPALRNDESRRYLVGPSVEIALPAGFALEADALYQRIGTTSTLTTFAIFTVSSGTVTSTTASPISTTNRQRGNSWEFPLLGKYYFRQLAGWQPFAATGFSFRTIGIEAKGASFDPLTNNPQGNFRSSYRSPLGVGAVVSAGARYKLGRFAIAPEIRYTRYGTSDSITNRNAVSGLVGFTF